MLQKIYANKSHPIIGAFFWKFANQMWVGTKEVDTADMVSETEVVLSYGMYLDKCFCLAIL